MGNPTSICRDIGLKPVRLIGFGGFGIVYLAEQPLMSRSVAVKFIPRDKLDDPRRAAREIAAGGQMSSHPNSLPLYDARIVDEYFVLIMEYAAGGSLEMRLKRQGPMSIAAAVRLLRGIGMVIDAAHAPPNRILHRDIKPANILLSGDGTAKLGDFGLAKFLELPTFSRAVAGTLHYMAPEILEGKKASPASDIYAFGATLYTVVTGRVPHQDTGATREELVRRILHRPADVGPLPCTGGVQRALVAAMDRDSSRRPVSATAYLHGIDAAAVEEANRAKGARTPANDFDNQTEPTVLEERSSLRVRTPAGTYQLDCGARHVLTNDMSIRQAPPEGRPEDELARFVYTLGWQLLLDRAQGRITVDGTAVTTPRIRLGDSVTIMPRTPTT